MRFATSRRRDQGLTASGSPGRRTTRLGLANAEFVSQTGQLLDRLGIALRDSGGEWRPDPGIQACAALGLDWCRADVGGATFTNAWRIFSTWSEPRATGPGVNRRLVTTVRSLVRRSRR